MRRDTENATELWVRQELEHRGFHVARIPEGPHRTADYRVSDARDSYLIEVKHKEDDPSALALFENDFATTGEAVRHEPTGRTNTIAGLIRDAADQLLAMPAAPTEFRLICFVAGGASPQLQMDQFRSTLYGEIQVVVALPGAELRAIPCYYYTFSEFHKHPQIDGAISFSPCGGGLYLNRFSRKADALRHTELFKLFAQFRAVCDPRELEEKHEALVVDSSTIDRRDKASLYGYLLKKYGFSPQQLLPLEGRVAIARIGLNLPSEQNQEDL